MQEQVRKHAVSEAQKSEAEQATVDDAKAAQQREDAKKVTDLTDDILADIDEALQGLDQDLASSFVQQGGQ